MDRIKEERWRREKGETEKLGAYLDEPTSNISTTLVTVTENVKYHRMSQQLPSPVKNNRSLKYHTRQNNDAITYKHHDWGQWFSLRFPFNLFCLLMIGYQIPISLSCSFPCPAPCCSPEECFGEHLEAGCWIGSILVRPCAPASALGAETLSRGPRRSQRLRWGWGGGKYERKHARTQDAYLGSEGSQSIMFPCTRAFLQLLSLSFYSLQMLFISDDIWRHLMDYFTNWLFNQ